MWTARVKQIGPMSQIRVAADRDREQLRAAHTCGETNMKVPSV